VPVEPVEPVELIERMEPVDPVDPVDPVERMESVPVPVPVPVPVVQVVQVGPVLMVLGWFPGSCAAISWEWRNRRGEVRGRSLSGACHISTLRP
jgi:hypothetical protein